MNWRSIGLVYRKELRDSLRDRRTIFSMIVVPVLAIPLMMFGFGEFMANTMTQAREEIPRVMVVGGGASPKLLAALNSSRSLHIVPADVNYTNAIIEKRVRAVISVPDDFDSMLARGETANVTIYEYAGEFKSSFAAENLDAFFRDLNHATVRERLEAKGLPASVLAPFQVQRQNVAPPAKVAGNSLGGILPYIFILLILTGAMYPALDMTAGEKERGTLETVLCSPVGRTELVLGKFLTAVTASLGPVTLAFLSMTATLGIARRFFATAGTQQALSSLEAIDRGGLAGVFLMLLPVAVTLSAILLMIGLFSKSFREAQSYCGPLIMVVIVPAVAGMLPGVELTTKLALVPVLNASLVCKEMVAGVWHWNYILIIFGSSTLYASLALAATVRMFHREEVLFRS